MARMRADPDLSAALLDSARRARPPNRRRLPFRTQRPRLTDRRGRPLDLRVMGGPRHDRTEPGLVRDLDRRNSA